MGNNSSSNAYASTPVHMRGNLAGIGIVFSQSPRGLLIVKEVLEGSSAASMNQIQRGDILRKVDGKRVGKTSEEITPMILGIPGEPVTLRFLRLENGKKVKFDVTVERTMKATSDPSYSVSSTNKNTRVTHVYLECMRPGGSQEGKLSREGSRCASEASQASPECMSPGTLSRTASSTLDVDDYSEGLDKLGMGLTASTLYADEEKAQRAVQVI
mmetsp:Transcript_27534/g.56429  ORF Transcript_27534/g.56429 Transcript_27534/m.56429 type:complete len:214 (+) Transcript_27534:234-875(+)